MPLQLKARNYEEAIDSYNKLDAVLSRLYGSMLHGRGVACSMLKQHQQAALDLKQAVEKQPHKANYWVELGQEYTLLNDYSNVSKLLYALGAQCLCQVKAVELDPHNNRWFLRMFTTPFSFSPASCVLPSPCLPLHTPPPIRRTVPLSRQWSSTLTTTGPGNSEPFIITQVAYSPLRLPQLPILLPRPLHIPPFITGMSAFEIEHYAAALEDLVPALTRDPTNTQLLTQVGLSLLRLNRYRESQPFWEAAVQADPGEARPGEEHPGEESSGEARPGEAHLGEAHPEEGEAWVQKGITHRILGEGDKAVDSLLMALSVQENIDAYRNLVATRRYQGDHWGAIEWCNKGLAFRPEDEELLYVRASMHHALGDHATALSFYDHLLATATEQHMTFNQAVSYYQREVLLYTVARLDRPFSAFQIDDDMDVDFKVAWLNRRVPPGLPNYQNLSVPASQLEGATWQLLPQLSEAALAVIAAADEIGWRAHYDTDGVMPNKQQLRMAGLAALDVMQQVRATWEAIADGGRLPSIVEDDDEEGEEGEGAKEGRAGEEEEGEGEWDKLTSPPRMPLKRFSGSGGSGGSSGGESVQLVGSWRQLFQVMVPWRQLSDPTEPPLWKAMFKCVRPARLLCSLPLCLLHAVPARCLPLNLPSLRFPFPSNPTEPLDCSSLNQRFQGSFHSHTPIHTWKQFSSKYNAIYDRAVEVTRRGLLEGQQALDEDGNVIPVPRDVYGPKIEAAKGHEGLYHAIGRDFYLRLPLHSMAKPGTVLHGTEFKLEKKALSIDFQTYTKNSATQWGQLDDELTAAWESLSAAVLDLPTRATDSSLYQQRIRENILRISYYWFQLMPLSRGSAMVGLVSILGLSMAADMETTARIPRDVLVDWEGLFATRFQDFYDAVAPWLYSSVKRSPWHLPIVREALPTTRHVLAALSYK
ncbi:unnamed protein product [Closterium sp. Naga37s-1]|nr:unnamed protein product [Closterium sp. Naga37s-1]